MKKTILVLVIVLVLTFIVTLTASATEPAFLTGYLYNMAPGDPSADPPIRLFFCFHTGTAPGVKDGFMDGCGYIYDTPGLAQPAFWEGHVEDKQGTCVIHVREPIKGVNHVVMNQCTGELQGFHLIANGYLPSLYWEGTYHWETLGE